MFVMETAQLKNKMAIILSMKNYYYKTYVNFRAQIDYLNRHK